MNNKTLQEKKQAKNKGLLFSIEALMTASIIILVILAYSITQSNESTNTKNIEIMNQSEKAMTLYFNENQTRSNPATTTQYCSEIETFDTTTKQLISKTKCGGKT